jgi:hypothetical protein
MCVVEAFVNLFEANGFQVVRYNKASGSSSKMDERFMVQGRINDFFIHGFPGIGVPPSIVTQIEIDVTIEDNKSQEIVWNDKIVGYRRIGPNRGVFTGTEKVFMFVNRVFSDAIDDAWIDGGMKNALKAS